MLLINHLKRRSTLFTANIPKACPACQCVRFEEKQRQLFDVFMRHSARFQCSKCGVYTLVTKTNTTTIKKTNKNNDLKETHSASTASRKKFLLGCKYAKGHDTPLNKQAAFTLFLLAAKEGHLQAQYNLGVFCIKGIGTAENLAEGEYWLAQAASNGHSGAQKILPSLTGLVTA